jgi:hypothetical protein
MAYLRHHGGSHLHMGRLDLAPLLADEAFRARLQSWT